MKRIKMITLLAIVTLFTGCNMAQGPQKPVLNGSGKISRVEVSIGGNARTLLPVLPPWSGSDPDGPINLNPNFSKYILSAEPAGGNTATPPPPVQFDGYNSSATISLAFGEWLFTVTTYINVGGTDYAAAKGSVPLTVYDTYHSITIPVNTPQPGGTGTFTYTVRHPSNVSVSIKLEPLPLGQPFFNETANHDVQTVKNNIPSGMHFLTVSATANNKTIIRNEIVHIYQQATTNAEYVFTKADFEGSLNLSGTVKVLVNGQQPEQAYVYIHSNNTGYSESIAINFTGNDGSGTWSGSFNSQTSGINTLYFDVGLRYNITKEVLSIPIPVDDMAGIDLGIAAWNFNPLPIDTWVDGEITTNNGEDWYSINVTAGETYYFWFNKSTDAPTGPVSPGTGNGNGSGDGTKTLEGHCEVYYDYITFSFGGAWNDPAIFTANDSGIAYIRVAGWSWDNNTATGTYAIAYSTNSHWHNNSFPPNNAVPLPADTCVDGNITTSNAVDYWYSINVTAGTTYYFWFNNFYGDGTKTLEGFFVAYYSNGQQIFLSNSAWNNPYSLTANSNGTVYIMVASWSGSYGTYAIAYSTNHFNNPWNPVNAIPLTADVWANGEITTYGDTPDWYSINVIAGTTYYFWFNNIYDGDGTKTLEGVFGAYYSNGYHFWGDYGYAWNNPVSFTANANDTVYISVRRQFNPGTYAIMYSATPRSGIGLSIRTAFDTNSNLYLSYNFSSVDRGNDFYAAIYDYMNYSHNPALTYTWFIDGVPQNVTTETSSSGSSYREAYTYLPTSGLSAGAHYGLVVVTIDGAAFTREFVFNVYE